VTAVTRAQAQELLDTAISEFTRIEKPARNGVASNGKISKKPAERSPKKSSRR
jgi:hypothetical protein